MSSTESSPLPSPTSSSAPSTSSRAPITINGADYVLVAGIGQTVISALTIIGSIYLLVSLLKQGRGKLRVRLLLGMIACDLALGIIAFVPNVFVLSGGDLITGSSSCNWHGFILTGIVFCQHLYTLMMAVATFLLLKYPLSPVTSYLERYSWMTAPVIFVISFIHSGGWWAGYGWASTGTLCYYRPYSYDNGVDARDLVQFIPRATVFLTILVLYSMLFKFLRRPDSIQLSSQFVSGENADVPLRVREASRVPAFNLGWIKRKFGARNNNDSNANNNGRSQSRSRSKGKGKNRAGGNPEAPWEDLEFVRIGTSRRIFAPTDSSNIPVMFTPTQSILNGDILQTHSRRGSHLDTHVGGMSTGMISPEAIMAMEEHPYLESRMATGAGSQLDMVTPRIVPSDRSRPSISSFRTATTDPLVTPMYDQHFSHHQQNMLQRPSEATTMVNELSYDGADHEQDIDSQDEGGRHTKLSPVFSLPDGMFKDHTSIASSSRISLDLYGGDGLDMDMKGIFDPQMLDPQGRSSTTDGRESKPKGQTMVEYLQETAFDSGGGGDGERRTGIGGVGRAERGGGGSDGAPQMSAATYFNRQASLLMLYFPLVYMAVFSLSLVRLLYDMVHNDVDPVLSMISTWFVLSVGLIDAIVYGIAEVVVKRKVRRKMGDR